MKASSFKVHSLSLLVQGPKKQTPSILFGLTSHQLVLELITIAHSAGGWVGQLFPGGWVWKNAKWGGKFGEEKCSCSHPVVFFYLFSPGAGLQRRSHLQLLREFIELHFKLCPSRLKRHRSLFCLPAVASGPDRQLLLYSAAPPVGFFLRPSLYWRFVQRLQLWVQIWTRPQAVCSHWCLCFSRLAVVQIVAVGWNSYLTWKANKMWVEIRRQRRQLVCSDSAPLGGPTWGKRTKKRKRSPESPIAMERTCRTASDKSHTWRTKLLLHVSFFFILLKVCINRRW